MELVDTIQNRYSCRKFRKKHIDIALLEKCVITAHLAPSACNAQPWKFYIVNGEEVRKEFVKLTQPFTEHASFIVVEEDKPNMQQRIVNKLKDQEYSKVDIGLACGYLCLQASELGLATCMIGYFHEAKIKERLGIAEKKRLRLVIAIGYADPIEKRNFKRKDVQDIMKIF